MTKVCTIVFLMTFSSFSFASKDSHRDKTIERVRLSLWYTGLKEDNFLTPAEVEIAQAQEFENSLPEELTRPLINESI